MTAKFSSKDIPSFLVAAVLIVLAGLFHLVSAAIGYPIFRDQHLGAALNYAREGINLLQPVIPGFNANGVGTPQEIPLWQAAASVPLRYSSWWGWANVVSLLCFLPGVCAVYLIARRVGGKRFAGWAAAAFVAQPVVFYMSGQASADGLSLTLSLWAFYFLSRLAEGEGGWGIWLGTAVFGALSACTKLPLFFAAGAGTALVLLLGEQRRDWRRWAALVAVGIIAAVAFALWTSACNAILAQAVMPFVDLSLKTNPAMWRWYFGDLAFRLDPGTYIKGGWMALSSVFGSFALAVLVLAGFNRSNTRLVLASLGGALAAVLVFTHLVLVHRHYYILFSLPVALLLAGVICRIHDLVTERWAWARPGVPLAAAAGLLLSTIQGLIVIEVVLDFDPYPRRIAQIITEYIGPEERILIQGGGWGGKMLMLTGMRGLTINTDQALKTREQAKRLREMGYTKLVMISESPLLWALKKTNPGQGGLERASYRNQWSAVIEPWPVIFQNEDILIKEIPSSGLFEPAADDSVRQKADSGSGRHSDDKQNRS